MSGYWFESGKQSTELVMRDSNGLSSEHQGRQPEFFCLFKKHLRAESHLLVVCAIFFGDVVLECCKNAKKGDTNDDAAGFSKDLRKIEKHNFSAGGCNSRQTSFYNTK